MDPTVEMVGDIAVVRVNMERLDTSNVEEFKRQLSSVAEDKSLKMVLDMSRLTFVDSSGCGAIISCLKRLRENGGDLKLCQVESYVRTVFELIRLHRICDIVDTRDDAVAAFEQS